TTILFSARESGVPGLIRLGSQGRRQRRIHAAKVKGLDPIVIVGLRTYIEVDVWRHGHGGDWSRRATASLGRRAAAIDVVTRDANRVAGRTPTNLYLVVARSRGQAVGR